MSKTLIESLEELTLGDYEDIFGEEILPEMVIGLNGDSTVRCRDGVWRPFQDAHSHGLRASRTTESHGDEFDSEAFLEY